MCIRGIATESRSVREPHHVGAHARRARGAAPSVDVDIVARMKHRPVDTNEALEIGTRQHGERRAVPQGQPQAKSRRDNRM